MKTMRTLTVMLGLLGCSLVLSLPALGQTEAERSETAEGTLQLLANKGMSAVTPAAARPLQPLPVEATRLSALGRAVSVHVTGASLERILQRIAARGGVHLSYLKEAIAGKEVTLHLEEVPVLEALREAIRGTGLKLLVSQSGQVILVEHMLTKVAPQRADFNVEPVNLSAVALATIRHPAQTGTITGTVTDASTGETLPGVNVVIDGTQQGAATDADGQYRIPDVEAGTYTLVASFVGYGDETEEGVGVVDGETTVVNFVLQPGALGIDEVVVVGYSTQEKRNVTGSVSTVTSAEISTRSAPSVANILQGQVPGLRVVQNSGQPGATETSLTIRGLGSYGASSSPLVLIDGVVGSLDAINPSDIESVTILKDAASAAIYGARAANGVILVTTKSGKPNTLNVTYTNNLAIHQPTRLPDLIYDSVTYMKMFNRAAKHSNSIFRIPQERIEEYRENNDSNPLQYPNFNWMDYMFSNAFAQKHNLSISGGGNSITYRTSLGLYSQDGVLPSYGYQRYNLRLSLTSQVNETTKVGANISLERGDRTQSAFPPHGTMLQTISQAPTYRPFLPDGSGRYTARAFAAPWHNRNPVATTNEGGRSRREYSVNTQAYIDLALVSGLVWSTKGAVSVNQFYSKLHNYAIPTYFYFKDPDTSEYPFANNSSPTPTPGVYVDNGRSSRYTLYSTLEYALDLNEKHELDLLIGTSLENFRYDWISARRIGYPTNRLKVLNAGSTDGQQNAGSASESSLLSVFGTVNYVFANRYLLKTTIRYDGSSKLAPGNRWGLFPAISAGWTLSEERFLRNAGWLDNLKLRVSYGKLGNQAIGRYPYQQVLSTTSYPLGSGNQQGIFLTRLTDPIITWETTTILDIGLDYNMLDGIISFTADWYKKDTEEILYPQPIPSSVGLDAPVVNYGAMLNKGVEINVEHNYHIGTVDYEIGVMFSKNENKITQLVVPSIESYIIQKEGLPWNTYRMYEWIGIFQSEEDIANSPTQPYPPKPGDLKLKDQNGDGVINVDDKVVVEGAQPDFRYSVDFAFNWKTFDFSMSFFGVQGQKRYLRRFGIAPFTQASPPAERWRNAWTPENKTNSMPALYMGSKGYPPITGYESTFYLYDASYLRLKNVTLGYNIPRSLVDVLGLESLRVYLSADNLFVVTSFPGADPARQSLSSVPYSAHFPQLRMIAAGVNITL